MTPARSHAVLHQILLMQRPTAVLQVTHSAHYFEELYPFAVQLIRDGLAYVCQQTPDEIKDSRWVYLRTAKVGKVVLSGSAATHTSTAELNA